LINQKKKFQFFKFQIPKTSKVGIWNLKNWNLINAHKKSPEFLQGFKFPGG
jgi:hypothetical protein